MTFPENRFAGKRCISLCDSREHLISSMAFHVNCHAVLPNHSGFTPVSLLRARKHVTEVFIFRAKKISKSLHSVITWKPLQADLRDCFRAVCPGTCSWEMNQSFPSILFLMVLLLAAVRAANWQLTEGLLSPRDRKIPVTCGQCWACTLCLLPITETETMVSSVRG